MRVGAESGSISSCSNLVSLLILAFNVCEEVPKCLPIIPFFLPCAPVGPILSTLSTVVLVKAKIVLVGLFLAGIYFFGHKIFPGGFFGSSFISETPPPFLESSPYTSYHSGHEIISSYPGPESTFTSFDHSSSSYGTPASSYGPPSNAYLPPSSDTSSYSSYSKYSGTRRKRAAEAGRQQTAGSDANEDELEENE